MRLPCSLLLDTAVGSPSLQVALAGSGISRYCSQTRLAARQSDIVVERDRGAPVAVLVGYEVGAVRRAERLAVGHLRERPSRVEARADRRRRRAAPAHRAQRVPLVEAHSAALANGLIRLLLLKPQCLRREYLILHVFAAVLWSTLFLRTRRRKSHGLPVCLSTVPPPVRYGRNP